MSDSADSTFECTFLPYVVESLSCSIHFFRSVCLKKPVGQARKLSIFFGHFFSLDNFYFIPPVILSSFYQMFAKSVHFSPSPALTPWPWLSFLTSQLDEPLPGGTAAPTLSLCQPRSLQKPGSYCPPHPPSDDTA